MKAHRNEVLCPRQTGSRIQNTNPKRQQQSCFQSSICPSDLPSPILKSKEKVASANSENWGDWRRLERLIRIPNKNVVVLRIPSPFFITLHQDFNQQAVNWSCFSAAWCPGNSACSKLAQEGTRKLKVFTGDSLQEGIEARTGELNHPSLLPLALLPLAILETQITPGLHLQTPQNVLCCKHFVLLLFVLLYCTVPRGSFWLQKFWSQNCHKKPPKHLAAPCSFPSDPIASRMQFWGPAFTPCSAHPCDLPGMFSCGLLIAHNRLWHLTYPLQAPLIWYKMNA